MSGSCHFVPPEPLPYHRAMVQYLRGQEPELWAWFTSTRQRDKEAEAVRLDLLKSTYRLEPEVQPQLHESLREVRAVMGIEAPITLYQAQAGPALNAAVAYLPGEAHIVLSGPLTTVLSANEMRAVLAHELGHFLLLAAGQGEYLAATDLLRALSQERGAVPAQVESARLFSLWTEVYADRWACHVSGDPDVTVAALLKIETGLADVSAASYLRQAEEIFSKTSVQASEMTHPELYIRVRALELWSARGDEAQAEIERMIQGPLSLDRLDLLAQERARTRTRCFLQTLLAPAWFRTEPVMAHARRFFADWQPKASMADAPELLAEADASWHDYLCYLMLDFVTVDRDLGEVPLAHAMRVARRLGLEEKLDAIVQRELGLSKKALTRIKENADATLVDASREA